MAASAKTVQVPSPTPIPALTVQPAPSTVRAALWPLPEFGMNEEFFIVLVTQYPISIDSYPIKHRGHAGLSYGLMSPLFDGEPSNGAELPRKRVLTLNLTLLLTGAR